MYYENDVHFFCFSCKYDAKEDIKKIHDKNDNILIPK